MIEDEIIRTLQSWGRRLLSLRDDEGFVGGQVTVWASKETGLMADLWTSDGQVLMIFRTEEGVHGEPHVLLRADGASAAM